MAPRKTFLERGKSYNLLIALCEGQPSKSKWVNKDGRPRTHRRWWVICTCGEVVLRNMTNIKSGRILSCGCVYRENVKKQRGRRKQKENDSGEQMISEATERERCQDRVRDRVRLRDPFISIISVPPSLAKLDSS